jgi:hypothetical protein
VVVEVEVQVVVLVMVRHEAREVRREQARIEVRIVMQVCAVVRKTFLVWFWLCVRWCARPFGLCETLRWLLAMKCLRDAFA